MLRAPIWITSPYSATRCAPSSSIASVTIGSPVSRRASASSSSPRLPSPWNEYGDVIQIGARNMQNYSLLKTVGRIGKPVLLKRGPAATISDLLLSAEYILAEGNPHVVLCERGLRSFDPATRNMFDLTAIPIVHKLSHLPIVADPSHGTGLREHVPPMARAALAAGADGLMIEVHPNPERALSDGGQSLYTDQFARMMPELRAIATAIGREIAHSPGMAPVHIG